MTTQPPRGSRLPSASGLPEPPEAAVASDSRDREPPSLESGEAEAEAEARAAAAAQTAKYLAPFGLVLHDHEFDRLRALVRAHFGLNITQDRKLLVTNRLARQVAVQGLDSYSAYLDGIEADGSGRALADLANHLTTNHTAFFRESAHFHFLQKVALPDLTQRLSAQRSQDLRLWCAAAATGEEAYSIAITLREALGPAYPDWDAGVLATDISTQALAQAVHGIYDAEEIRPVPEPLHRRYFLERGPRQVQVVPGLREEVLFRKLNLNGDPFRFKRPFHIIFCRNVMIYFDPETRHALTRRLWEVLEPGGFLFIGHAETIDRDAGAWSFVRPAVYRREEVSKK